MRILTATGFAALIVALGCDRATRSEPLLHGSFTVALIDSAYRLYVASGPVPTTSSQIATFAAALAAPTTPGAYAISGFRARGGHQDALTLDLVGLTAPGSYSADGLLTVGTGAASPTPYLLEGVTVEITALTADRIAGTFDGVGVRNTILPPVADTIMLSGGSFDVPIIRP